MFLPSFDVTGVRLIFCGNQKFSYCCALVWSFLFWALIDREIDPQQRIAQVVRFPRRVAATPFFCHRVSTTHTPSVNSGRDSCGSIIDSATVPTRAILTLDLLVGLLWILLLDSLFSRGFALRITC